MRARLTPRELFQEYLQLLQRSTGFRDTLLKLEHKEAFDLLLEETWNWDEDAIVNSGVPCIMDTLNLVANIHLKRRNEKQREILEQLEREIKKLESRVSRLKIDIERT